LGCEVWGLGFGVLGLVAGVHGMGFTVWGLGFTAYTGTSLMRNSAPLGPYGRTLPRALCWFQGSVLFLISEVPLYGLRFRD